MNLHLGGVQQAFGTILPQQHLWWGLLGLSLLHCMTNYLVIGLVGWIGNPFRKAAYVHNSTCFKAHDARKFSVSKTSEHGPGSLKVPGGKVFGGGERRGRGATSCNEARYSWRLLLAKRAILDLFHHAAFRFKTCDLEAFAPEAAAYRQIQHSLNVRL
jgi:hypothetical protein